MSKIKIVNLIVLILFLIALVIFNNNIERNITNKSKISEKKYNLNEIKKEEKKHIISKDTIKVINKNIDNLKINKYQKEILSNFGIKTNKKIINYYDIYIIKDKINKKYLKKIIILKFDDEILKIINDDKHFIILDKINNNLYLYSFDNNYKIIDGCEIKMYKGKKSLKKIYKDELLFLKDINDKLNLKVNYINLICNKRKSKGK